MTSIFLYDNIQELQKANGSLAQLARASALQAEGHWFESINSHHTKTPSGVFFCSIGNIDLIKIYFSANTIIYIPH